VHSCIRPLVILGGDNYPARAGGQDFANEVLRKEDRKKEERAKAGTKAHSGQDDDC